MFSMRKYSIRKVSVGIASVLIGIAAGSFGTAYANEDINNVVVSAEVNHDVNLEHVNKPVSEEEKAIPKPELAPKPVESIASQVCEDCKHEEKTEVPHIVNKVDKPILEEVEKTILAPEIESKSSKQNVSLEPVTAIKKEDNLIKSILEDKIDWNSIDEKEFVNYLFADIKVDKKKEQEIKEIWLIKVNELLAGNPNNVNLQKVKAILENSLKSNSLVEIEKPKEEKVTENKKENKEPVKTEDNKDNKESVKETDKKEVPKGQTVPENKQEVPGKETPKVTSDKTDSSNNKKQETSDKTDSSNNKTKETSENNAPVKNKILSATLSGRDVAVSFDKNKIKADDVFVGAINDEKLNKAIIEKLGSEYKVVEVFEIHFKKDGKKLDSDAERTVKVSVVKNDNAELEVYHIADNNVLEKVQSSFSDGSLQFKINHFSKFTILERIRVGAKDLESRVQIATPVKANYKEEEHKDENSNNNVTNSNKVEKEASKKDKEELPKTGLESEQTISMALLALVAAIAIRRKQKQ